MKLRADGGAGRPACFATSIGNPGHVSKTLVILLSGDVDRVANQEFSFAASDFHVTPLHRLSLPNGPKRA
jgi:hypothetical protein